MVGLPFYVGVVKTAERKERIGGEIRGAQTVCSENSRLVVFVARCKRIRLG
jgi:hypothetical protein